jgi:hypothetical protein
VCDSLLLPAAHDCDDYIQDADDACAEDGLIITLKVLHGLERSAAFAVEVRSAVWTAGPACSDLVLLALP